MLSFVICFFGILRYKVQNLMCNQDARCRCTSVPYHCSGWWGIFHVSMGFRIRSETRKPKKPKTKRHKNTESHENRKPKFASQMLRPLCLGDCRRCLTSKVFVTKLATRNHPKKSKEMQQWKLPQRFLGWLGENLCRSSVLFPQKLKSILRSCQCWEA